MHQLQSAGVVVFTSNDEAVREVGCLLRALNPKPTALVSAAVDLSALSAPFAGINVGLESFAESLRSQGAAAVHVDWRPPAGGDERLMALLERMKGR